jgi:hypothetical protein
VADVFVSSDVASLSTFGADRRRASDGGLPLPVFGVPVDGDAGGDRDRGEPADADVPRVSDADGGGGGGSSGCGAPARTARAPSTSAVCA